MQLLETIKIVDGEPQNLKFHNLRYQKSLKDYYAIDTYIPLEKLIKIPDEFATGLVRCRFTYNRHSHKIEFSPYIFRKIESLKLVFDDSIEYPLKYTNRVQLTELFNRRDNCDDIIIVKESCLTDSYSANLVFSDGKNWFTPDTPLLPGTMRASLLHSGQIKEKQITLFNFRSFKHVGLINAFLNLENMPMVPVNSIII